MAAAGVEEGGGCDCGGHGGCGVGAYGGCWWCFFGGGGGGGGFWGLRVGLRVYIFEGVMVEWHCALCARMV